MTIDKQRLGLNHHKEYGYKEINNDLIIISKILITEILFNPIIKQYLPIKNKNDMPGIIRKSKQHEFMSF